MATPIWPDGYPQGAKEVGHLLATPLTDLSSSYPYVQIEFKANPVSTPSSFKLSFYILYGFQKYLMQSNKSFSILSKKC
jgi:hypothetical protein